MKKTLIIFSLLLLIVSACKKETVDMTDLLKTVPSSAAGVLAINVESMIEDAGGKVKDHKVEASKTMEAFLAKPGSPDTEDFKMLFKGDNGIEPKGAVVFYDSNRAFLTVALYDVSLFKKYIETKKGISFKDESNGVSVCGNVAVKGTQAWVCLSRGKSIDPDAIYSYSNLATPQSFLVTDMGEKLLVEEDEIRGWAVIDTFMQQVLSRSQRSMFTIGSSFLFENPQSVEFKVEFKKGELEMEAIVLNEKGKPAKYQLPAEKVDVAALKTLGTTCDAMMAFTVNSKLIKKFDKVGSALGGALFGDLGDTFKNVDGTVGIVTGGEGIGESVTGLITTKGDLSKVLMDMVSQYMGTISTDNKFMRFSKGDVKGGLSVEECAEELKGCCMGIIVDPAKADDSNFGLKCPQGFRSIALKFKPESGGLQLEVEAKTTDQNQNALEVLLSNAQ